MWHMLQIWVSAAHVFSSLVRPNTDQPLIDAELLGLLADACSSGTSTAGTCPAQGPCPSLATGLACSANGNPVRPASYALPIKSLAWLACERLMQLH